MSRLSLFRPRLARTCFGLLLAAILAGCATTRPWRNAASTQPSPARAVSLGPQRSLVAGITLSGGGTRAAAFGLGVLREMKATAFHWDGRDTTLLDEITFVSGVSGGSILAAHYAAFGDETLRTFEADFLRVDVPRSLASRLANPSDLHNLTSPWYGRSHLLAEELDKLFRGRTFGDVATRAGAPDLLITATDLRNGFAFEFTQEQLALLCTDWREVPLSFAAASSAAVPLLLSPMTLHNHAGNCPNEPASRDASSTGDYRTHLREALAAGYADVTQRPYVHLVDGGLADNLGLRGLLDRFVAGGSIGKAFDGASDGSIRRLVLVVVNAERDISEPIDQSDAVPTAGQVLDALLFGAGARDTQITLAILREDEIRWRAELEKERGRPGSPFAADAELHVVTVGLNDVPDVRLRRRLLRLPTSLSLPPSDVQTLESAARDALRASRDFQRLLKSLQQP